MLAPALCESAEIGFDDDYAWLWNALREDYPFILCLEDMGLDVEQIERDYADRAVKCRSVNEFAELMADLFYCMNNLAHLEMIDAAAYDEYMDLAEKGVLDTAYSDLICDAVTQSVYAAMPRKANAEAAAYALPQLYYYEDICAVYIRFQTFNHACLERDRSVVEDALKRYPDARHVIFDITGNGGGSDYYWMENIVAPVGGEYGYENVLYFRNTPLTQRFGLMDSAVDLSKTDEETAIPADINALNLTHKRVNTVRFSDSGNTGTDHTRLKRWVLIDGGTYSAADGFATFCKETGWATLVGTQTMGDGGSAAPLMVRLPDTGLLVQFSCAVTLNSDGSLNAIAGTLPDYRPNPKESPLEACLRLIEMVR